MWKYPLPKWICESCGSSNDEDLVTCTACNSPHPQTESYADFWIDDVENDTGTGITSIR